MPSLIATLGANIAPFVSSLESAKTQAKSHGEGIGSALGHELQSKLAGFASIAGVEEIVRRTVEWGSRINDLSIRLGISAEAVQEWDYALKLSGSSIDAAVPFFEKLAIARAKALDGNEKSIDSFRRLGVSIAGLQSGRLEDVAAQIGKAFETGDPQQLIDALRDVGGKGAGAMIATFREGFGAVAEEARKAGLIVSEKVITQLDEASDAFTRLKTGFTAAIAPALVWVFGAIEEMVYVARSVLAVPIGALTGLIDAASKLSLKDILTNPAGAGAALAAGAAEGVTDALGGLAQMKVAEDDAAKARRERMKKGLGGGEDDGAAASKKKELAEAEKIRNIHEQIAEIRRKSDLDGLSATEKRAALEKQIAVLKKEHDLDIYTGDAGSIELAGQEKTIAEREAELKRDKLAEEKDELKANKLPRTQRPTYESNALQQVGGIIGTFSATSQVALLDVQKKSESHLASISKDIRKLSAQTAVAGVQF